MGRAKPQAFRERPSVDAGNELYLNAFYELDGERHIGMSIGRIPWSAIQFYADHNGFDDNQTEALHMLIQKLDAVHLQRLSETMRPKDTRGKPN